MTKWIFDNAFTTFFDMYKYVKISDKRGRKRCKISLRDTNTC